MNLCFAYLSDSGSPHPDRLPLGYREAGPLPVLLLPLHLARSLPLYSHWLFLSHFYPKLVHFSLLTSHETETSRKYPSVRMTMSIHLGADALPISSHSRVHHISNSLCSPIFILHSHPHLLHPPPTTLHVPSHPPTKPPTALLKPHPPFPSSPHSPLTQQRDCPLPDSPPLRHQPPPLPKHQWRMQARGYRRGRQLKPGDERV